MLEVGRAGPDAYLTSPSRQETAFTPSPEVVLLCHISRHKYDVVGI